MLLFSRFLIPALSIAVLGCSGRIGGPASIQTMSVTGRYTVSRNLIYTPEDWPERVPADFYRPRTVGRVPAVVLIHGGGWTGEDGRWQMDPIARKLAERGYAVLNVTYRLAPKSIYPAPVEDVREAVRWLRDHADEKGIDTERIALFGYSAGGYLAAMAGYAGGAGEIRAVVAGGTPGNLALYPGGDLVPQFLGGTRDAIPERFHEASPVNYISEKSPPTFIYHATEDKLVPREHAWEMIAGLEKAGVPHQTYWIKGKGHVAAFLFPAGAVEGAIGFLDRWMGE